MQSHSRLSPQHREVLRRKLELAPDPDLQACLEEIDVLEVSLRKIAGHAIDQCNEDDCPECEDMVQIATTVLCEGGYLPSQGKVAYYIGI